MAAKEGEKISAHPCRCGFESVRKILRRAYDRAMAIFNERLQTITEFVFERSTCLKSQLPAGKAQNARLEQVLAGCGDEEGR